MSGLYVPSTYESNCQAIFCLTLGVEAAEDCSEASKVRYGCGGR